MKERRNAKFEAAKSLGRLPSLGKDERRRGATNNCRSLRLAMLGVVMTTKNQEPE
jgi:hypothetical protein